MVHRGYPIEQLAQKSNFLETAYLLIYGDLPSNKQYKLFENEVMHHTFVHNDLDKVSSSSMMLFMSLVAADRFLL